MVQGIVDSNRHFAPIQSIGLGVPVANTIAAIGAGVVLPVERTRPLLRAVRAEALRKPTALSSRDLLRLYRRTVA